MVLETTLEQTANFVHSCGSPFEGGVTLCILYILNFYFTALEGVSREWKAVYRSKAGSTVLPDEIVQIWGPGLHQKYLFEAKFLFSVTHHRSRKSSRRCACVSFQTAAAAEPFAWLEGRLGAFALAKGLFAV